MVAVLETVGNKELQACVTWHCVSLQTTLPACFDFLYAGGVDEGVISFISHLKEVKQLRKVEMTGCENLSLTHIATICGGLCTSNSMVEVEVKSVSAYISWVFALRHHQLNASSVSELPCNIIYSILVWPFSLTQGSTHNAVRLSCL